MPTDEVNFKKPCFGQLETVFPLQEDGLRESPVECLDCPDKTSCLRAAISGSQGPTLAEERVDRAYQAGVMGFFERWSKKKSLKQQQES